MQLENGANLGYEAVFDLSRPYLKPIAVPRLDDGTPIVRDRPWSIKITPATIYGLSMASASDERGYRFAWRSDVGLVPGSDNPSQYARRVAKAGHASAGANMRVAPAFVLLLVPAVLFQPKTGVRKLPISQWVS